VRKVPSNWEGNSELIYRTNYIPTNGMMSAQIQQMKILDMREQRLRPVGKQYSWAGARLRIIT
jgi:hypothetical protein